MSRAASRENSTQSSCASASLSAEVEVPGARALEPRDLALDPHVGEPALQRQPRRLQQLADDVDPRLRRRRSPPARALAASASADGSVDAGALAGAGAGDGVLAAGCGAFVDLPLRRQRQRELLLRPAARRACGSFAGARGGALVVGGARAHHLQIVVGAVLVVLGALAEPGEAPAAVARCAPARRARPTPAPRRRCPRPGRSRSCAPGSTSGRSIGRSVGAASLTNSSRADGAVAACSKRRVSRSRTSALRVVADARCRTPRGGTSGSSSSSSASADRARRTARRRRPRSPRPLSRWYASAGVFAFWRQPARRRRQRQRSPRPSSARAARRHPPHIAETPGESKSCSTLAELAGDAVLGCAADAAKT